MSGLELPRTWAWHLSPGSATPQEGGMHQADGALGHLAKHS